MPRVELEEGEGGAGEDEEAQERDEAARGGQGDGLWGEESPEGGACGGDGAQANDGEGGLTCCGGESGHVGVFENASDGRRGVKV